MNKTMSNVPDWLVEAVDACRDDLDAQSWSAAALHLLALGLWWYLNLEEDGELDDAIAIVENATGKLQRHTPNRVTNAVRPDAWGGQRTDDSPHYAGGYLRDSETIVSADGLGSGLRFSRNQLLYDEAFSDVRDRLPSRWEANKPEWITYDAPDTSVHASKLLELAKDMNESELRSLRDKLKSVVDDLSYTPQDEEGDPDEQDQA